MAKQIGWFNLKEDKVFTNYFECAAWYENVLVKAGRYPVVVSDYRERESVEGNGRIKIDGYIHSVYVSLPGTITSDDFTSLFCGVPISDYDTTKNKGKEGRHVLGAYMYNVAESILKNPETEWELFPEYEAREYHFSSCIDGTDICSHGIFLKEERND